MKKLPVAYTVLSTINLIAAAVVTAILPELVGVHFTLEGKIDRVGSAWVFLALPAAAVLLSFAVFLSGTRIKRRYAGRITSLFAVVGALLVCSGWMVLGLAAQDAGLGGRVAFPYAAVTALPLSFVTLALGGYMFDLPHGNPLGVRTAVTLRDPAVWRRVHRRAGAAILLAGLLSAVCAVGFTCFDRTPRLDWVALVIWDLALALALIFGVISGCLARSGR